MGNFDLLDKPYPLTKKQKDFYTKNAFIKLKNVLDNNVLAHFNKIIGEKVEEHIKEKTDLLSRDTYGKAFLQIFNLWRESDAIKELIFSKRIAQIATDLMGTTGVRMYHDQALFKEPGGGYTPFHADQFYWPLATDRTITAWIPLQATPLNMGPLEFRAGSHEIVECRELSISDESEAKIAERLRITDFEHVIEPFDIGEISFHSGWLFHRAGPNTSQEMRKVMTIIYMDKNMQLKAPENDNQQKDWEVWCPEAKIGEVINSPLNPVMFEY